MDEHKRPPDPSIAERQADNSCGVAPFETGEWDPYAVTSCAPHDEEYNPLLTGDRPDKTNVQTQIDFVKNATVTAAKGLYAVVTYPVYVLVGAVGGYFRWKYLEWKYKKKGVL